MTKNVIVPIAHGTEEMEAVIIVDMLRRAGIMVKVAGEHEIITCSRGVKMIPDLLLNNLDLNEDFDAVILPGGMKGTNNLLKNEIVTELLKRQRNKNGLIAAICAAPLILADKGILKPGQKITSHPSAKEQLITYSYQEQKVIYDEGIVTSRGAGTAFEFVLYLIELLSGPETSIKIAQDIVLD